MIICIFLISYKLKIKEKTCKKALVKKLLQKERLQKERLWIKENFTK